VQITARYSTLGGPDADSFEPSGQSGTAGGTPSERAAHRHPPPSADRPRQRQRRLSPEDITALITEYLAGADMAGIATRWGVHRGTVARHLQRAGVSLRRQGIPTHRLAEALRLYEEGSSCQR
jgi:hypothetical protein